MLFGGWPSVLGWCRRLGNMDAAKTPDAAGNREAHRSLCYNTLDLGQYISSVIPHWEMLFQRMPRETQTFGAETHEMALDWLLEDDT